MQKCIGIKNIKIRIFNSFITFNIPDYNILSSVTQILYNCLYRVVFKPKLPQIKYDKKITFLHY
jgi:hypothetical protein